MPDLRICRGCGCTDLAACPGGCSWVLMDFEIHDHYVVKSHGNALASSLALHVVPLPSGLCSRCAEEFAWDVDMMCAIDGAAEMGLNVRW